MSYLAQAQVLTDSARSAVETAARHLAQQCVEDGRISSTKLDEHQAVAYDLATVASAVAAAEHLVISGERGEFAAQLALVFAADLHADLRARIAGREAAWGLEDPASRAEVETALAAGRDPHLLELVADHVITTGELGGPDLPEDLRMVRETFRRFSDEQVVPVAEQVHREDLDLPEHVIQGLAELGCFALSIPSGYGGMSEGGDDELVNMVLVTEELSRGSLGVAGSLITRPEIISTAILKGGTEEQKSRWLPQIASGEKMCAVAVTEPDVGSDVAAIKMSARRDGDDWVLNGVKTWCTFAGRAEYLLVLARTDPDPAAGHRGLSLFVIEKEASAGHAFTAQQPDGGSIDARAIPTIGYRGMHSFEISFEDWRVPHDALIGEEDGLGRGFYLQMQAFSNARLQTAARAQGVMQAALDEAIDYSRSRQVFGRSLVDHGLTRAKLARMAALLAACRVFAFEVARRLARDEAGAQLAASQVKQLACRVTEWTTREAQQLHGGYGYAEEYTVSRLFVDGRVLSIFEGADEVLALKVIARAIVNEALATL